MNFRKTILAASLSACASAAMAADKTPTLGDVFKASGVTVNGYLDFSYNDLSTDQGSTTYRAYDTENRGFALQMADLSIGYQPASGFGGFAELNYGSDAQVNNFAADPTSTAPSYTDVQQAYMQYANGPFTVMAGKFDTIAGYEVIQAPSNTNFSRSYLFTWLEPAFHTGLRGIYTAGDALKFTAGINNGWNVNKKSLKPQVGNPAQSPTGNTLELGVSGNPAKMLSLSAAYYTGKESGLNEAGTRDLLDLVATLNATDALSFVLAYDTVKQEHGTATGDAKLDGIAGYVNYKFSDMWRVSLRTEQMKDKDGILLPLGSSATEQTLKETTLTVGYAPASSVELRAEYRQDKSDQNVFTDNGSGTPNTDKQHSLALEAVYKF
jgi:Putative beta-barrel porin-2, OmpL-like. bbp2